MLSISGKVFEGVLLAGGGIGGGSLIVQGKKKNKWKRGGKARKKTITAKLSKSPPALDREGHLLIGGEGKKNVVPKQN